VTLTGPSRTIVVEPLEAPSEARPAEDAPPPPAPERLPEPEPQPAPAPAGT
jgi:hypothetical protein